MAPRLSRWIALTVIAAGVVATSLLTTAGTPLLFLSWGRFHQEEGEVSPSARRLYAVRMKLQSVRGTRAWLEQRDQVAAVLSRSSADPLVLRPDGSRLVVDIPATSAVDSVWRRIPTRRGEVRTVIVRDGASGWWGNLGIDLGEDGLCLGHTYAGRSPSEIASDLRSSGGECLFAEQFGVPGKGVREWQAGPVRGLSWDRSRRVWWELANLYPDGRSFPAWFEGGARPDQLPAEYAWRQVNRLEMACLLGRVEECAAAAGVDSEGWPDLGPVRGLYFHQFPTARMPRDLLQSVGPERFAAIWSSDAPIATSYAQVTGAPIDEWVIRWAVQRAGVIRRDNALSLVGGLGALVWITLLALLITERLKQRAAT